LPNYSLKAGVTDKRGSEMVNSWQVGLVALWAIVAAGVSSVCTAEPESKPEATMSPQDLNKFVGWFEFFQKRNAQKYAVTGVNHVDESTYVNIGGIDQWVTIRGQDRNNPVLLILHGGPGDVTNPWGYAYFYEWEKYFTVVQWDQRGAGRTLEKSGESIAQTMTIDRMVQDGIDVSEYLRKHLNQEKIVVVGHSWGSVLGLLMAKARPDLFYAFVGTGQVPSSSKEANFVAYGLALQWAQSAKNVEALADLKRIGPPPYENGTGGWGLLYKWRNACEGPGRDLFLASTLYYALAQPGYTLRDFNYSQDSQLVSEKALFDQQTNLDPTRLEGHFDVPLFVIQGEHDCTTPAKLAKKYLDSISAPRKDFVVIPGEGHFAAFIKSEEFLKDLIARVRPLALKNANSKTPREASANFPSTSSAGR
jgi:pimeloyl-ACP methyl ester carboxylesterase